MLNKLLFIFLLVFSLLVISCEGPKGDTGPTGPSGTQGPPGNNDEQIRLEFGTFAVSTNDTSWYLTGPLSRIDNFNKDYFTGVDSIIFVVNIGSTNLNTYCVADLFNVTDSLSVLGSMVMTNDTTRFKYSIISGKWCQSGNIIDNIPSKEISLAVRFRSDNYGTMVHLNKALLLLYRK